VTLNQREGCGLTWHSCTCLSILLRLLHFALEETIGTTQNDWFCSSVTWLRQAPGVDSSYNVQANMSVRRGFTRGISVHSVHKEKDIIFL